MQSTNKSKILKLYYEKSLSRKDIITKLNLSGRYITTIIKQDPRYMDERERRKIESKIKAIERKRLVKQRKEADYAVYEQMKIAHDQAVGELSVITSISNIAFRNWNSSIYRFNSKDRTYRIKRKIITGFDVPKKIMWH